MLKLAGKPVADHLLEQVRHRITTCVQKTGRKPCISVVLVGQDPASLIYTRKKGEMAEALGMIHQTIHLPIETKPEQVRAQIQKLNDDPNVDGILIQRPLPIGFIEHEVVYWVAPEKDVDAFHPLNIGRLVLALPTFQPCTPAGIMALLKFYGISLVGSKACVIGRSAIVGKPMAALLLQADATVIHCHSKTKNLRDLTKQADLLIVAAGKPGLIDASYLQPNAIVIDVGIHKAITGKTIGDVQWESITPVASAASPVPGGVGLLTIAILMQNTILAAELRTAPTSI